MELNERIKELAEQAGFVPGVMGLNRYTYFDPEKFAELIVRECIDVLIDVLPDIVPEAKDGIHPAWHIKDHFGVEQ